MAQDGRQWTGRFRVTDMLKQTLIPRLSGLARLPVLLAKHGWAVKRVE